MGTLTITNVSSEAQHVGDIYTTLDVGASIDIERSPTDLSNMKSLAALVSSGDVTYEFVYSDDEKNSGLASPPNAISGDDFAEVAAADLLSGMSLIRGALAAGGGGADTVTLYADDALPFKMRIVNAWALVSTNAAGSWTLKTGTDATTIATFDSTSAGYVPLSAETASTLVTPGATVGLTVDRSDSTTAGEIFIMVRRES